MRGRSLEEIDELFHNKVPTKGFPKYHCVSAERAREQALKNTGHVHEEGAERKKKESEVEQREIEV
jgi:hypothetical protein